MTSEIRHALGPLTGRADEMPRNDPHDRISLRDYLVEVEIGAFAVERGQTQRLRFNIVVEVAAAPGPLDDDVDRILSYDTLIDAVQRELAAERLNLLETLAERIASRILCAQQALRVFLRIEKLDRGPFELGVEIVRSKAEAALVAPDKALHPRVVFVATPALLTPQIIAALGRDAPLVVVVDVPPLALPVAADARSQRRIQLLAMEQSAIALASRLPGVSVVGSRTELDWAIGQGHACIWAPSRMVLDAVPVPEGDAMALGVWLAHLLHAVELLVIGAAAPETTLPTRVLQVGE